MIKLLLVEDHKPVRQALYQGLEATGEVLIVAQASTAREAIAAVEASGTDASTLEVALMDVELRDPELGALAAERGRSRGRHSPRTPTIPRGLLLNPG